MKKYMSVSLIIGIITVSLLVYYFYKKESFNNNAFRVAIFEPASHPSMDEITQGFMDTMRKHGTQQYNFTRYNANGNPTLMRSQAEEIIHQNYDLVMTIGTNATKTMHELTTKKQLSMPIVFAAMSDPVKNGIVASLSSSGNNVTGIQEIPQYEKQVEKLLEIKPATKNVLLVYDPVAKGGGHESDAQQITNLLQKKNIQTNYAKIFHSNEIQAKVQPLLPGNDVVMIFTDHTVVSGVDSLITLCNRYHVTLFTSELNSADKGAALSYGVTEYDYGVETANQAIAILEKKQAPRDIPISIARDTKLKVNTKTMSQQGLPLPAEQLEKIKKDGGIIL